MAGTVIADYIQAAGSTLSMNVGNTLVLTANASGLTYVPTGNVNINIGSTASLTMGNVTVTSNVNTRNLTATGTLGVTGATTLSSTLAAGNTTITGTLAAGNTTITGAISATTTVAGSGGTSTLAKPSRQVFTSGSAATYTTPANVRRIVVRMKGPGGSTAGSSSDATGGGAGTGTATSFNSITAAVGGNSGQASGGKAMGGAGGTGGTGAASFRLAGNPGSMARATYATGTNAYVLGGDGGGKGGGQAKDPSAYGTGTGMAGVANSGGGASGSGHSLTAAFGSASGIWTVGGGGEGEYVEYIVDSPSATYTYTVGTSGAGGTAGNNGFAGASGGSGLIVVDEYY
jgi:hypothetical protein